MILRLFTIICLLVITNLIQAQNALSYGTWRTHYSYRVGHHVTQGEQQVYFATEEALVEYDKDDLSVRFISEADGLSQTGIQHIQYVEGSDVLMIVYNDGLIDLYDGYEVKPMAQIKNFTNISLGKEIHNIKVTNDSIVYLATSYGVSKVNVRTQEFEFSTFTGVEVSDCIVANGYLWAATGEGIYRIDENNDFPEIFTSWEYVGESLGFPDDYTSHALAVYNGVMYCDVDSDVYRYESGVLTLVQELENTEQHLDFLTTEGEHLIVGFTRACTNSSDCGFSTIYAFDQAGNKKLINADCSGATTNCIEDQDGRLWLSTLWNGFRRLDSVDDSSCTKDIFQTPWSNKAWELDFVDGELWGVAGGYDATRSPTFVDHGIFNLDAVGQWNIFNRWTNATMKGDNSSDDYRHDDLFDLICVKAVPQKRKVYAGSFLEGLVSIDMDTREVELFNEKNSSLQTAIGGGAEEPRVRVTGIAYEDAKGSVWISNSSASQPLTELKADGTWQAYGEDFSYNSLYDIEIDDLGNKWVEIGSLQSGLLVYKEEGENGEPAQSKFFNTSNSELTTNEVLCIEKDLNGDIWVGTTDGVIIFERGADVFDSSYRGTRRIVEGDDGIAGYLLETESIQAIATDGANRKWIGTSNRLYLLSEDGKERIAQFTADNSELPSSNILDITIDGESGEVFIATTLGLVSYQSDATAGTPRHNNEVVVYPNPVRPNIDEYVFVKGLSTEATVKITDIAGNLVYETKALGGQVKWDGTNYRGQRVSTGTYLVFSTDKSSFSSTAETSTAVARIVFIH